MAGSEFQTDGVKKLGKGMFLERFQVSFWNFEQVFVGRSEKARRLVSAERRRKIREWRPFTMALGKGAMLSGPRAIAVTDLQPMRVISSVCFSNLVITSRDGTLVSNLVWWQTCDMLCRDAL